MEFDFSQLEVIALAHLTQDPVLINDIENGVDMHTVNAAKMYDIAEHEVTPSTRKIAKRLSFQLQYGAGYKSMAKACNVSEELAKRFIEVYYNRYVKVKEWQDATIATVKDKRLLGVDKRTKKGLPQGVSTLISATGRRYVFKEYDAPEWSKKETEFSPTEIKNYPVQGFATGDIVPMILGKVYRELKSHPSSDEQEHIKLINTVHDSIVFDVDAGWQNDCYDIVHPVMCNVAGYLKDEFYIDFDIPIAVDCQIGKNWMEMKDFK